MQESTFPGDNILPKYDLVRNETMIEFIYKIGYARKTEYFVLGQQKKFCPTKKIENFQNLKT